jgi:DNA-binding IclR family transcriptional regulator
VQLNSPSARRESKLLSRAVLVLGLLAEMGPSSPGQLMAASGLARPTMHRILGVLVAQGLVVRPRRGRYRLGLTLLAWGRAAVEALPWVGAAHPALTRLSAETGRNARLYVREDSARICVDAAPDQHGNAVVLGRRLPLDAGASGRVLLAWSDDAWRFPRLSDESLAAVRQRGWAYAPEEGDAGASALCAPVFHPLLGVCGALCLVGPAPQIGADPGPTAARVVETARQIRPFVGADGV